MFQLHDHNDRIFLILMNYQQLIRRILTQNLSNYDSHSLYLELSALSVKMSEDYLAIMKNFNINLL
jgi:hypothetical protein